MLSLGTAGTGILLAFLGLAFAVVVFNIEFKLPQRMQRPVENAEEDFAGAVIGNKIKDDESSLSPEIDLPLEVPDIHVHRDEIIPLQPPPLSAEDVVELIPEFKLPVPEVKKELTMDITMDDLELAIEESPEEKPSNKIDSVVSENEVDLVEQLGEYDPKLDLSSYQYPILDFARELSKQPFTNES